MKCETIILENNQEYAIAKEKENFILLINTNILGDFCIRKTDKDNIISLESEEELNKAIDILFK